MGMVWRNEQTHHQSARERSTSRPGGKGKKRGHAKPEDVDRALRELRHLLESERFASLALPRLATGAGGLDWDVVRPLVEHHLGGLTLPIYIYI